MAEFEGLRISTSYPGLVSRHLEDVGVKADVIRLDGAVETSVRLGRGRRDRRCRGNRIDVAAGRAGTCRRAVAAKRGGAHPTARRPHNATVEQLKRRLNGVIVASAYVIFDYDVRTELLDAACALTPGIESPTISPLRDDEWVAVRALVPKSDTNAAMDQLYELGARGILVTDIHACRL